MRKVSPNITTEIYFWGCNPSFITTADGVFMIDTPQQPIDAVRWRETIMNQEHGPIRYLVNTEPHPDHVLGNAYFPGVEVIGQSGMVSRYAEALTLMGSGAERLERMKQSDPDSVWLLDHPSYPPNPPTRLFDEHLSIQMGELEVQLIHHAGHTAPQTSVFVPGEGVVLTGDNVFHQCKTFIQEADPWEWLQALRDIEALDVQTIVPGHGEPCDKSYLRTQAEIIQNWVAAVEDLVRRGHTEDEALAAPLELRKIDPYPIGQRLFPMEAMVNAWNIRNLYRRITAREREPE